MTFNDTCPHKQALVGYRLSAPASWAALPLEGESGWVDEVIALLAPRPETRATLRQDLQLVHRALNSEQHLGIGAWMPFPETGSVLGAMAVDLMIPNEGSGKAVDIDEYRELLATVKRQGVRVISREIFRDTVNAGPCLTARETVMMDRRVVEYHVVYSVFPLDSCDAIELTFCTPHLELAAALDTDSRLIADSLTLSTGER
ncbi:MAG: hypothetical protein GXX79_15115 [Actinomycetales bacterium]|nr:hypothetical protein [Actinomycetales bacterium]